MIRFQERRKENDFLLFAGSAQWRFFQSLEIRTSAKLDIG